jgi:hypothetical protein
MTPRTKKRVTEMEPRKACEREHDFALVLTGITELTPEAEDALFEAGCDDATLSVRSGRVFLIFSRAAPSLGEAVLSAIRDVKKANIGADVLRVDVCDLVSQSDIARKIGRSRQLVHQYANGDCGPGGFPPPASYVAYETPLWYWSEVAAWLRQNRMIKEDVLREAQEGAVINSVLELQYYRRLDPALTEEVLRAVHLSTKEGGRAVKTVWRLMTHHQDPIGALDWARTNMRLAIGWGNIGDIKQSGYTSPDDITGAIRSDYPDETQPRVGGSCLYDFCYQMKQGDLVILSTGKKRELVMEVVGDYEYRDRSDAPPIGTRSYQHQRKARIVGLDPDELWNRAGAGPLAGQSPRWTLIQCRVTV